MWALGGRFRGCESPSTVAIPSRFFFFKVPSTCVMADDKRVSVLEASDLHFVLSELCGPFREYYANGLFFFFFPICVHVKQCKKKKKNLVEFVALAFEIYFLFHKLLSLLLLYYCYAKGIPLWSVNAAVRHLIFSRIF